MARIPTLKPTLRSLDTRIAVAPRGDAAARSAKVTLDFYGSAAWKAIRVVVQREAKRTCESCGKTDTRIYVDHRIEMRDGGAPLERSNLQALCGVCHARKSAREREKRAVR